MNLLRSVLRRDGKDRAWRLVCREVHRLNYGRAGCSGGIHLAALHVQILEESHEQSIFDFLKDGYRKALCFHAYGQALSFQEGRQMSGVRSARRDYC